MSLRASLAAPVAAALLVPAAHARPLTTAPVYVLTIHVTITDARVVLDRSSAPRGVEARFVIQNVGTRAHNFTLNGARARFSRTLAPHRRKVALLFLDYRGRVPYLDALPAERSKSGMRGFFVID